MNTVNVEIFAQYIFSRISSRVSDARKFDVSENHTHNRTNRNKQHIRENSTARICLIGLEMRENLAARKYLRLQYVKEKQIQLELGSNSKINHLICGWSIGISAIKSITFLKLRQTCLEPPGQYLEMEK